MSTKRKKSVELMDSPSDRRVARKMAVEFEGKAMAAMPVPANIYVVDAQGTSINATVGVRLRYDTVKDARDAADALRADGFDSVDLCCDDLIGEVTV